MKIKSIILSLSLLNIFAISPLVTAQSLKDPEKAKQEAEQREELERKTLQLLEDIIASAQSLKLPENRSFILISAGDLLWEHDEKRARALFWEALSTLATAVEDPSGSKSSKSDTFYTILGLRREFLQKIARRDAQLALELQRITRQPGPPAGQLPDYEIQLQQEIAGEAVASDPARALQIARDSMAKGISFEVFNFLYRLNEKDGVLATKFAGELVETIKGEDLSDNNEAAGSAFYLLEIDRESRMDTAVALNSGSSKVKPLVLKEEDRRALVGMLVNSALSGSPNRRLFANLQEIMPDVEKYFPERVAPLRRKLSEFSRTQDLSERSWNEYNLLVRTGTPEEMLKAAKKAPVETREMLYREAVLKAVSEGDPDKTRQFINNQIEDASRRTRLIDLIDQESIGFAINRGDVEGLRELLPNVRLKDERARAMAYLAIFLAAKGERKAALELLNEARLLLKFQLKTETQAHALLTLVMAYALVEPTRSFEIIEQVVDHANEQVTAALALNKFLRQSGFVKNGEILLRKDGLWPPDFILVRYGKGLRALASVDFSRLRAIADRFQRNELRIAARLLIAQSILSSDLLSNQWPRNN